MQNVGTTQNSSKRRNGLYVAGAGTVGAAAGAARGLSGLKNVYTRYNAHNWGKPELASSIKQEIIDNLTDMYTGKKALAANDEIGTKLWFSNNLGNKYNKFVSDINDEFVQQGITDTQTKSKIFKERLQTSGKELVEDTFTMNEFENKRIYKKDAKNWLGDFLKPKNGRNKRVHSFLDIYGETPAKIKALKHMGKLAAIGAAIAAGIAGILTVVLKPKSV